MTTKQVIEKAGGLVSLADIARLANVSHTAARRWPTRGDFPEPVGTIAQGTAQPVQVWTLADVDAWHRAHRGQQLAGGIRTRVMRP